MHEIKYKFENLFVNKIGLYCRENFIIKFSINNYNIFFLFI